MSTDKPVFERDGADIIITSDREYRFDWRDVDMAVALFHSLTADYDATRRRSEER